MTTTDGTSALVTNPSPSNSLWLKLAHVAGEISRIEKHGYNEHFKYFFAADADIYDAVRPLLAASGIAFFASMVSYEQQEVETRSGNTTKTWVHMLYRFMDGETGEVSTHDWNGEALDNQDKGINKATKAALKYFLISTFMISTGNEDDPDAAGEEIKARGQKQVSKKGQSPAQQQSSEPVHYLATEAGKNRLKKLFDELHITPEEHAYYLEHIETDRKLTRFGETTLSETDLHNRIRQINGKLEYEHANMQPAQPKIQNGQPAMSATEQARFIFKDGTPEDFDRLLTTAQQGGLVDQKATVDEITRAVSGQLNAKRNASKPKVSTPPTDGGDVDAVITSVFVVHDGTDEKLHNKPRLKLKVKDAMGHEHSIGEFSGEAYYSRNYFPRADLDKVGETYEAHIPCKIYQANGYWNVRYDSLATIPVEMEPVPEGAENVDF